jgi:hypothetical protein
VTNIVDEIRGAFPASVAPGRPITGHRCHECDEVDRLMGGRTWADVAEEFPTYCHDTFPLLTPEAKAYYLPAYMCFDLTSSGWAAGMSVSGALERGEFAPEQFDNGQRTAIVHWIEQYYGSEPYGAVPESLATRWKIVPSGPAG